MTTRVLVVGGYGNFGRFISRRLAGDSDLEVIIAGRSLARAERLAREIGAAAVAVDIDAGFARALSEIGPDIVIHTAGPFQAQDYRVAETCISQGRHYIDLADGRGFVAGFGRLDRVARENGVLAVSGASSLPCLTAVLVDHFAPAFQVLETLDMGITTAQRAGRGLATTAAILGQAGRPFETLIEGRTKAVYGWQSLHRRSYREAGRRLLGNCDVPDLALFPRRYPDLRTVRFFAGLEIPLLHVGLWALSWLVRLRVIRGLERAAPLLLKSSNLFDPLGSAVSALHMDLSGQGEDGAPKTIRFELTARSGDGLNIPCIPAILIARKLARGEIREMGAFPCMGFVTKDEYLGALEELDITWTERRSK